MKKITLMASALTALMAFTGCDNNADLYGDDLVGGNDGKISLTLKNDAKVRENSRANEATDNGEKPFDFPAEEVNVMNYTLSATNKADGQPLFSGTMTELGANNGALTRTMPEGTFDLTAQNYDGSRVTVSTRPWFRGQSTISILPGKTTSTTVSCKLQNIQVRVSLGEDFKSDFLDDYTITVDNGAGAIQSFTKDNVTKIYYFQVPEGKNSISVNVKATVKESGKTIIRNYTVQKPEDGDGNSTLEGGDAFILNINTDGSMLSYIDFGMTVDFSFADQEFTFEIDDSRIIYDENNPGGGDEPGGGVDENPGNMEIEGLPQTYANPVDGDEIIVNFKSIPKGIEHLYVTITPGNAGFGEIIGGMGLGETFDMAEPGDLQSSFEELGLLQPGESVKGATDFKFNISGFIAPLRLFDNGNHVFHIKVVDTEGNVKEGDLKINIDDM